MISNKVDKTNVTMKAWEKDEKPFHDTVHNCLTCVSIYYGRNMSLEFKTVNKDVRFHEARNARSKDSSLRSNFKAE